MYGLMLLGIRFLYWLAAKTCVYSFDVFGMIEPP
jgi:hypothetical protein